MTYIQGKNPISRKTSPLNANNPFKRVSPLNMPDDDIKHKDMSKADKKKHKSEMHGRDPEQEQMIREEEGSQENNIPIDGMERVSSIGEDELSAYKNASPEDIPGYDDGAGGFDYERMSEANSAPGAEYSDEEAEAAFDKMKYTTDANIRKGAGVDLGIIKKK